MRGLPRTALLSFAGVMTLAHVALHPLVSSLRDWGSSRGLLRHSDSRVLSRERPASDLTVVGTSMSACLVRALRKELPDAKVSSGVYGAAHIGDEVAIAVDSARLGDRLLLIELNPLLWNLPAVYFGEKEGEVPVVAYPGNAEDVFPALGAAMRSRLLRQLGVNGVMERAVGHYAPARLREAKLSTVWVDPLSQLVFARPRPEPTPDREAECRQFLSARVPGPDLDVLNDLLRWLGTNATLRVAFFFPPLNRTHIGACGEASLANVDAVMAGLHEHIDVAGFRLMDLSRALPDGRFVDFGHVRRIDHDCLELAATCHGWLDQHGLLVAPQPSR